jgi:hypothetical protein
LDCTVLCSQLWVLHLVARSSSWLEVACQVLVLQHFDFEYFDSSARGALGTGGWMWLGLRLLRTL